MTDILRVHAFAELGEPATTKQISEQVEKSNGTVYVFYSHPSVYIAHGLKLGKRKEELIESWLRGINHALNGHKENRRKVRLICLEDALNNQQKLAQETGLSGSELKAFELNANQFKMMAGHQLAMQNDDILRLIGRLEASSLQLGDQFYSPNIDVESVLSQIDSMSSSVDEFKNDIQAYRQRNLDLENENNELMKNTHKLRDVEDDNELLLLQLQQVQEELERYFIEFRDNKKQLAKLRKQLEEAQAELENKPTVNQPVKESVTQGINAFDGKGVTVVKKNKLSVYNIFVRAKRLLNLGKGKKHSKEAQIKAWADILRRSVYFDGEWYLRKYPDLGEAGVDPAEHYLRFGGFESRDPGPKFSSSFYLMRYPDVKSKGVNPLLHFVLFGEAEGRMPKPKSRNVNK